MTFTKYVNIPGDQAVRMGNPYGEAHRQHSAKGAGPDSEIRNGQERHRLLQHQQSILGE